MLGKLCVCGHEMKPQGKQTLEMNGSSLGSNLWTDHVEVDMYICSWCGRMAFFEPEDVREKRFRDACEEMTMDELRAIVYDANPDMLRAVARERIEELESIERYKAEQKQKRRKGVQSAKNSFRVFSAGTRRTTASRPKTTRRSFDEFIVKVRTLCTLFA